MISESQESALSFLSKLESDCDPTEAGLHQTTMAALRRRGLAKRTKFNRHVITDAGRSALVNTQRREP